MDFYKILNKEECHNGLQYKFGLNIDILEFNPSGDCEPGGIYFSKEDIFAFFGYGPWIRKVTLPEDAQIYENPGKPKKWKADKVILDKKEKITAKVIKRLIDEGADPTVYDNYPLKWAARKGRTEVIKILIPYLKVIDDCYAIRIAARHGHLSIVKLLLPLSNTTDTYEAFLNAAEFGQTSVVDLLIPLVNPQTNNSEAFRLAILNKRTDTILHLYPVSKFDDDLIKFCKEYGGEFINFLIETKSSKS